MKCDWFSLNWYRNAHVLGFYKLQLIHFLLCPYSQTIPRRFEIREEMQYL